MDVEIEAKKATNVSYAISLPQFRFSERFLPPIEVAVSDLIPFILRWYRSLTSCFDKHIYPFAEAMTHDIVGVTFC